MTDETGDARFEDGGEAPLRLRALDAEDLAVISALAQDAVLPASEMSWSRRERRFALLLNRFRWEDAEAAERRGRGLERVQSVLVIEEALAVRHQDVPQGDADTVLSLLSVDFAPGPDGTGTVTLTLAGDGVIAIDVEALEVLLKDVTRPWLSPSGKAPGHEA
ncbi:DUF2948 family protein [Pseudoroseicyclus aestuarii]|uniref:DUF2948 family protein n=1 Tax=Pseudoroseicyclus aestuarii TaxID=1795041 RepID=A0A318T522_9RHOB|nr:DUF2948 family protein [Pseudoroseicyclus aestuarii]PYE85464.1 hypothetical protein DFP88_101130 [Pseudoroseicyclus aestuarii]